LLEVAQPVAAAMSALHQIEAHGVAAIAQNAPLALDGVRRGLGLLQAQPVQHPAVNQAMEAIAGSLGLVHGIAAAGGGPQVAAPAWGQAPAPQPPAWGGQPPVPQQPAWPQHPQAQHPQAQHPQAGWPQQPGPGQQPQYPAQPGYPQPAPQHPAPQHPVPQQAAWAQQPAAPAPVPAPAAWPLAPAAPAAPAAPPAAAAPVGIPQPGAPAGRLVPVPGAQPGQGEPVRAEANLGAHSATNFYKGLSGNDVVDSGGVFIATYQIPKLGQNLLLKVSLPGGYEFEAKAVVRWTREGADPTGHAPPGFGAQFTEITAEGRQLVYRYVRNREPLFHDDF
jgi:hypothetical protein